MSAFSGSTSSSWWRERAPLRVQWWLGSVHRAFTRPARWTAATAEAAVRDRVRRRLDRHPIVVGTVAGGAVTSPGAATVTLVLVGPGPVDVERAQDLRRRSGVADLDVIRSGPDLSAALRAAGTRLVCVLADRVHPVGDRWLAVLLPPGDDEAPVVTAPGTVRASLGSLVRVGLGRSPRRHTGVAIGVTRDGTLQLAPTSGRRRAPVVVPSSGCLVVDRLAAVAADSRDIGDLVALGWPGAAFVGATVVDARPERGRQRGQLEPGVVRAHGPALRRAAGDATPRIVIDVAAPNRRVARRWGDVHLAEALARALRRRGLDVAVRTADEWDDPAGAVADVRMVVRGRLSAERLPGQRHVLWVISHPSSLTDQELDAADLVLVASSLFAEGLRHRTSTPVSTFLQATDHRLFHPRTPDPGLAAAVGFVGKTRDVFRSSVRFALQAGVRPAIWGSGWERFVDPTLVRGEYVPNEDLPAIYASLDVLLNDHWDDMRSAGFVSNRCFDALACGTVVVSDHQPSLEELFDGGVVTYESADELAGAVKALLASPDERRARANAGHAAVLAAHTFDHRSAELLDLLDRLGLLDRHLISSSQRW